MRIRVSALAGLALVLSVSACGSGRTEGAGAVEDTIPAYNPDTLAWVKQSRPVIFDDRGWLRTGETVNNPSVTRVGQFEGMVLYAPANQSPPYQQLLFPVGNGQWQLLEPISRVPKPGVDTAAATSPPMGRLPGDHSLPKRHTRH